MKVQLVLITNIHILLNKYKNDYVNMFIVQIKTKFTNEIYC